MSLTCYFLTGKDLPGTFGFTSSSSGLNSSVLALSSSNSSFAATHCSFADTDLPSFVTASSEASRHLGAEGSLPSDSCYPRRWKGPLGWRPCSLP